MNITLQGGAAMEKLIQPEHRYLHMMTRMERLLEKRNRYMEQNKVEHVLMEKELQRLEKQLCHLEQEIVSSLSS